MFLSPLSPDDGRWRLLYIAAGLSPKSCYCEASLPSDPHFRLVRIKRMTEEVLSDRPPSWPQETFHVFRAVAQRRGMGCLFVRRKGSSHPLEAPLGLQRPAPPTNAFSWPHVCVRPHQLSDDVRDRLSVCAGGGLSRGMGGRDSGPRNRALWGRGMREVASPGG